MNKHTLAELPPPDRFYFGEGHLSDQINKLIRVFMVTKPYELEYHYRTKSGKDNHKKDLPALKEMIALGMVERVDKTSKAILYRLLNVHRLIATGEKEVQP